MVTEEADADRPKTQRKEIMTHNQLSNDEIQAIRNAMDVLEQAVNNAIGLIHKANKSKGFWENREIINALAIQHLDPNYANFMTAADCLVQTHCELSEGIEALRKPVFPIRSIAKDSFGGELADAMIRVSDTCGFFGIPLGTAIKERILHNLTRPPMHDGKIA